MTNPLAFENGQVVGTTDFVYPDDETDSKSLEPACPAVPDQAIERLVEFIPGLLRTICDGVSLKTAGLNVHIALCALGRSEFKSQRALAKHFGVSPAYVSQKLKKLRGDFRLIRELHGVT